MKEGTGFDMAKYLDPKADVTFKKVFGEHKNLVISLLNALLPLDDGKQVESIEYLPPEMVPDNPDKKNSIVDVRCEETGGRTFIVEMQLNWTTAFRERVLFNAAKAYVRQIDRSEEYKLLQPVYSLNLVNTTFEPDTDNCYHYYSMVHHLDTKKKIDGLHLVFVELPKFKPQSFAEKKMAVLWLKFLTEIDENTTQVPPELLATPETSKALKTVEEAAMTKDELLAYEDFWDKLGAERLLFIDSNKLSHERGRTEGLAEGKAEVAKNLLNMGMAVKDIAQATGLAIADIEKLKQ